MKVSYIISTLGAGGAEMMLLNLVNRLPEQVEPLIIVLRNETKLLRRITNPRTRVNVVGLKNRANLSPWARLCSIIRREQPDVIHSHMLLSNLGARFTRPFAQTRCVINHEHGLSRWKGPTLNLIDRISQGLADRILVVSESSRRERVGRTGISPERIAVLPNAIDVGSFRPVRRESVTENATWGVVARLEPVKRVERALEIFAEAHRKNAELRLLIAGDGSERLRLEATAERLKLNDAVEFLGFTQDMIGFYSSIDVFLLTSELEDCPMTVIEALAGGRFVAATAVGGIPELLVDAPDALLFDTEDPSEVVADKLLRIGPGFDSNANREYAKIFDIGRYVERLLDLYLDLLQ